MDLARYLSFFEVVPFENLEDGGNDDSSDVDSMIAVPTDQIKPPSPTNLFPPTSAFTNIVEMPTTPSPRRKKHRAELVDYTCRLDDGDEEAPIDRQSTSRRRHDTPPMMSRSDKQQIVKERSNTPYWQHKLTASEEDFESVWQTGERRSSSNHVPTQPNHTSPRYSPASHYVQHIVDLTATITEDDASMRITSPPLERRRETFDRAPASPHHHLAVSSSESTEPTLFDLVGLSPDQLSLSTDRRSRHVSTRAKTTKQSRHSSPHRKGQRRAVPDHDLERHLESHIRSVSEKRVRSISEQHLEKSHWKLLEMERYEYLRKQDFKHVRLFAHGKVWTMVAVICTWLATLCAVFSARSTEFVALRYPLYIAPVYTPIHSMGMLRMEICLNETIANARGCEILHIESEDVDDHVFEVARLCLSLATVFGIFFSLVLSSAVFWETINLRPIGFGYLMTYFMQSFSMLIFDTQICGMNKCRIGTGCIFCIISSIGWLMACIATAKMEAHKVKEHRRRRKEIRKRLKEERRIRKAIMKRKQSNTSARTESTTSSDSTTSSNSSRDDGSTERRLYEDEAENALYAC